MQIAWSCNKEDLVALLCVSIRTTIRMAIRFAADCLAVCALQGDVHFVKGLEGSGDCSDAAHKQYCKKMSVMSFPTVMFCKFGYRFVRRQGQLTAREDHPDEVHEEIISPEIQKLWPRVCD
jgi:hypothetical protein